MLCPATPAPRQTLLGQSLPSVSKIMKNHKTGISNTDFAKMIFGSVGAYLLVPLIKRLVLVKCGLTTQPQSRMQDSVFVDWLCV